MSFLDKVRDILSPKAEYAPAWPARSEPAQPLPDDDPETSSDLPFIHEVDLYGIILVIEYCDATGKRSRRRISIITSRIDAKGVAILQAWCFERNACRYFRLDRIEAVIDDDGEIWEPRRFFNEELLVDYPCNTPQAAAAPVRALAAKKEAENRKPGTAVKVLCCDAVQILAALGRSDGRFVAAEVAVVMDYVLARCAEADLSVSDEDKAAVLAWIKRAKATPPLLSEALEKFCQRPLSDLETLLDSGEKLIAADGIIKDSETEMLRQIRAALPAAA